MTANQLEPKQALNKTYLKIKPDAENIEQFKLNLQRLLDLCDREKDEEFNKNLLIEFLKNTYYRDRYFINTKENSDLVIHTDKEADSPVGVIFETKKPTNTNSAEMPSLDDLNRKAVQQLVLYFLRERVKFNNFQVKHLVVTNIYEWFIFDGSLFEDLFYSDKALVRKFTDFEAGRLSGKKTDFFYKEIAKPAIANLIEQIKFTYFDLREFESLDLVNLYKIFSPEHLLKLPFVNDSNSLNKPFYNELLYILGLTEIKEKGKKLIGRNIERDRHDGSLIENAIGRLESLDKISQLKEPEQFGITDQEKLFNVALRLSINWINRILFLKLLEAQLIKYHQGDRDFAFLNLAKVQNYDDLDSLFFDVLAKEQDKRQAKVKDVFVNVPYLNSSLFEPTETEQQTIFISNLPDRNLSIFSATVLKDSNGNKRSGELNALAYLFEFLDAYKFDRDELEDYQEDSEKLINAAVLGLIFEKINGYKDGSFYTPSFITMYMCRETIGRSILQKFNQTKGWNCENIQDLKDDLSSYIKKADRVVRRNEANQIVNSLKICDPAVGSGHFLVSALNEMIAIKHYLGILQDRNGEVLSQYEIEVVNDKLKVTLDRRLFAYNPKNKESQRVQETLFYEKQTIIEGCLFGVDINPNSVTICRLRLWIELLKNAFYRTDGNLETLPNIDINIKCGNSLISRFGLDVDLKQVLQKQKFSIEQYRNAVQTYRNAKSKTEKREMESLIAKIKSGFSSSLLASDPQKVKLRLLQAELYGIENQMLLLEETKTEIKAREKKVNKLNNEIDKLNAEIEDIESGQLYENALEWRFEFPEVLNDDGDFVGFDLIIGNPPYAVLEKERNTALEPYQQIFEYARSTNRYNRVEGGKLNLYRLFTYLSYEISSRKSGLGLIIPLTLLADSSLFSTRSFLLNNYLDLKFLCFPQKDIPSKRVFEDAKQSTLIVITSIDKDLQDNNANIEVWTYPFNSFKDDHKYFKTDVLIINRFDPYQMCVPLVSENEWKILQKIHKFKPIKEENSILIRRGEINQTILRSYITSNTNHQRLIKGVEISQYKTNITLSQGFREYFDETTFLNNGKINNLSSLRRIATQRINGVDEKLRLVATIIEPDAYFADSTNSIHIEGNPPYSLEFILGILNSRLFQWRFKKTSTNNNISTTEIEALPFNYCSELSAKITEVVDEILTAKKGDSKADTRELEQAIDRLVYKLYQLNYAEVKIIDPEFELTEQEYIEIKIE
jgi:adenine-specific DNA-methyltransferase